MTVESCAVHARCITLANSGCNVLYFHPPGLGEALNGLPRVILLGPRANSSVPRHLMFERQH